MRCHALLRAALTSWHKRASGSGTEHAMPPCEQCEDYILWWYQNTGLLRKRPPCPLCEPDDDGSADESGLGDNKVLGDNQGGEH